MHFDTLFISLPVYFVPVAVYICIY